MFVRNLFILELALNFPLFIREMASATGLESGRMTIGFLDSLSSGYSVSIAFARERASTSQGDHLLHCSDSLEE